jgi:hypothetical protein
VIGTTYEHYEREILFMLHFIAIYTF